MFISCQQFLPLSTRNSGGVQLHSAESHFLCLSLLSRALPPQHCPPYLLVPVPLPLLSLPSHTQAPSHWGRETPLERLWPRPGELTCPLRYAENTWAGAATLGLTPSHAASEPAKGLQLPLPLRDLRAGREGPASGG